VEGGEVKRLELERRGFVGWIPLLAAARSKLLPVEPGVYAVSYNLDKPVVWPAKNVGGWHKGRDPSIESHALAANWVEETDIVYLGKTDRTLAKRITEFARFGNGEPVGHWGGRLVWQLPEPSRLMIGWNALQPAKAISTETELLTEFHATFGKLPFANLRW
jgi:hypothetical protein